ncbi:single-stranded DNA-binding protein [bacterium]|nr:single-stranded DNA-binding protein [bacterium]
MAANNRVFLIGRLTRDPETRTAATGTQVTKFTLAVDRRSKNSTQTADFVPITAFNNLAAICSKYLVKGKQVAIEGRLQISSQPYPDDPTKYRTFVDVIADDMQMLGSRNDVVAAPAGQGYAAPSYGGMNDPLMDDGESDMEIPDGVPF